MDVSLWCLFKPDNLDLFFEAYVQQSTILENWKLFFFLIMQKKRERGKAIIKWILLNRVERSYKVYWSSWRKLFFFHSIIDYLWSMGHWGDILNCKFLNKLLGLAFRLLLNFIWYWVSVDFFLGGGGLGGGRGNDGMNKNINRNINYWKHND